MSTGAHRTEPALVFALYSEDRADNERNLATLGTVLRSMLELVRDDVKLRHIEMRPAQDKEPRRRVVGSYWKVNNSKDIGAQQKRRNLLADIATALRQGHVVFFHVDGDCPWKKQKRAEVWKQLQRFRRDLMAIAGQARSGASIDEALLDEAFVVAVPFYSMESWLFASTRLLRTLTRDSEELAKIDAWARDLARLDEEPAIKRCLPSIRDSHNHALARELPARALLGVGKSYAATVVRLQGSSRVTGGLEQSAQRPW